MIEQILKFSLGGNSRQMLRDAEGTFRAAYANASEDAKRLADALIQSASNYSSANPTVGRQNRLNQAVVYEEATRILKGEGQTQAPSISGGWGNRVINDYYALNNKKKSTGSSEGTSKRKYNTYVDLDTNWFGIAGDDEDLAARVSRLAYNIGNSLAAAVKAKEEGKVVRGLDKITDIGTLTNTMMNIAQQVESGAMDPRKAQAAILRYAPQLGITDKTAWDTYFGETDDLEAWERNLNALKSKGYTEVDLSAENDWIKSQGKDLKFLKDKSGKTYAFNKDYSQYTGGAKNWYNDDWVNYAEGTGYGDVFLVGDDGEVYYGGLNGLDLNSTLYQNYNSALNTNIDDRKKLVTNHDYNLLTTDTDSDEGGQLFEAVSEKLGQSFKGADVSPLFRGSEKILAVQGGGKKDFTTDQYGNVRFDGDTKFYSLNDEGKLVERSWDEMQNLYNRQGYAGDPSNLLGSLTDLTHDLKGAETSITGNEDMLGRTYWDTWNLFNNWLDAVTLGLNTLLGREYSGLYNINENPLGFALLLLNAINNQNGNLPEWALGYNVYTNQQFLDRIGWFNKKKDYAVFLYNYFEGNDDAFKLLTKEEKSALKQLFRIANGRGGIASEKLGGIIKAAKGTVLSGSGEDITDKTSRYNSDKVKLQEKYEQMRKKEQKALERGFESVSAMEANDTMAFKGDRTMTASDIMRLTTMAQDVASIVASFVPGAGTGVAAGLGVTSTITDLVADIKDPAVNGWDVIKNLGINAGFAVAGLIPGAKMGKVAKNVVKWAPRLMSIAAGAGLAMDESTQKTFKKIAEGKMQFTREDWKNISRVLQFAAGAVRTGKGAYDARQVKKGIVSSNNVKLEGVKSTSKLNGKEVDLEIPKTTYDEINTKLGKIDKKAKDAHQLAVDILKEYKTESGSPLFTDAQINQILKNPTLEGTKLAAGKYQLTKAKDTIDKDQTYDNLRDLWNKDATALQRQSETAGGRAAIWFANKVGGGAYGANQRAILADPSFGKGENPAAGLLDYQGRHNPFVDWKGLRNQAGMQMMSDRNPVSSTTQVPSNKTQLALPEYRPRTDFERRNPAVEKPYDGTDKVGDGIHVNPARNEARIKSELDIPLLYRLSKIKSKAARDYQQFRLKKVDPAEKGFVSVNARPLSIPKDAQKAAMKLAKAYGIPIERKEKYFEFLAHLKEADPERYRQLLSLKPTTNPIEFLQYAKEDYAFKLGGQLKYQHLRK